MRQACACASAAQEVPNTEDGSICPALTGRPDLWSYGLCLLHGVPVQCGVDHSRPGRSTKRPDLEPNAPSLGPHGSGEKDRSYTLLC